MALFNFSRFKFVHRYGGENRFSVQRIYRRKGVDSAILPDFLLSYLFYKKRAQYRVLSISILQIIIRIVNLKSKLLNLKMNLLYKINLNLINILESLCKPFY